jgi:hypothetical protein
MHWINHCSKSIDDGLQLQVYLKNSGRSLNSFTDLESIVNVHDMGGERAEDRGCKKKFLLIRFRIFLQTV